MSHYGPQFHGNNVHPEVIGNNHYQNSRHSNQQANHNRSSSRDWVDNDFRMAKTMPKDEYPGHRETIWRIVFDLISLSLLLAASIVSNLVATPFTRGFFCADMTIRFPYKDNTIPTYAAIILSIGLPVILMIVTEFIKHFYFVYERKPSYVIFLHFCGDAKIKIMPIIRNLYIILVIFAYGYLATWLLTEVAKNFVGELRPHFLAVCQPSNDCSGINNLNYFHAYFQYGTNFTCLNSDDSSVREARRSFFSGHSSSVSYGFSWLIMYIHISWSWRHLGILSYTLQVGIAVLGVYIGYTRISDFHHHWHDVFTGGLVGALIAFVSFKFILNWQKDAYNFLPYVNKNGIESVKKPRTTPDHMSRRSPDPYAPNV